MNRKQSLAAISHAIGDRRLIWVGTRGTDARPLMEWEQFAGVFCVIAPLGVPSWPEEAEGCLERLSRARVDLDGYHIDEDTSPCARELHRRLCRALAPGTLVAAYRPTGFLAAAYYPRMEYAEYLGVFHGLQGAFEHKPWVETELKARGVPTIPWQYFSSSDHDVMLERMGTRASVLRANYSDGGIGLTLSDRSNGDGVPDHTGGFLAMAPLLEPSVPLNVSACVFRDGSVSVRHPSVQLIGISSCTTRRFGYCGNDFAAAHEVLGRSGLERLQVMAERTGLWMREHGYVGAFGLDALLHEDEVYLTEINPRFQGSSAAAVTIARQLDWPDVYLDHFAAALGLPMPTAIPLHEQALAQAQPGHRLSQVVCYNTGPSRRVREDAIVPDLEHGDIKGAPEPGVTVRPNGMLFKVFVHDRVTTNGDSIPPGLVEDIARLTGMLYEEAPAATGHGERG